MKQLFFALSILLLLTGCGSQILAHQATATKLTISISPTETLIPPTATNSSTPIPPTATPSPTSTATPTPTNTSTATTDPADLLTNISLPSPIANLLATNTPSPTPNLTPKPTSIPILYPGLTIDELTERTYGPGPLEIKEILRDAKTFTRYLFTYPSDGLTIYGFMDVPKAEGPFPVALIVHGHLPANLWNTEPYTRRYTNALAKAGYLVLHPNMRGFYPSDNGMDWFRVGVAIDVLNLLAITKELAGEPGTPLEKANTEFIGLMGHSMGGGVALRVATIDPDIDATVLYSAMSGNERWNYEKILRWSDGQFGERELATPDERLNKISPIFYLDRIQGPMTIHNGEADGTTLKWGHDLCNRLKLMQHPSACYFYPDQPHIFEGEGDLQFSHRLVEFFNQQLITATKKINN